MLSEQRAMCFHSWWFCWSSAWPRPSRDPPSDRRPAPSSPPQQPRPKRGALSSAIPTSWWSTKWRWQPTGRERCSPNNIRNGDLPLNGPKSSVSTAQQLLSLFHFFFYECQVRFGLELVFANPKKILHTRKQFRHVFMCESSTAFSFSSLALFFFIFKIFALAFLARVCGGIECVHTSSSFLLTEFRIFVEYYLIIE